MFEFLAEDWRERLQAQGLNGFADFWQLPETWVEAPNRRRGGWSGVSRHPIPDAPALYVKRQENHVYRDWRHPLRGHATIAREWANLTHCQRWQVPTLKPVYAAVRRERGRLRAVLATEELVDYTDLGQVWSRPDLGLDQRRALITAVAHAVSRLHRARLQHNALYPKHVFVRFQGTQAEVRFIDLEKAKWRWWRDLAVRRDLDTLNRRWRPASRSDRLRFLLNYLGEPRLGPVGRRLWKRLARRWDQAA